MKRARHSERTFGGPIHIPADNEAPSWGSIAVGVLAVLALWAFLFALDAGLIR